MSNVSYAFVQNEKDNVTFESKVSSFGIDSVSQKDIASFYMQFSKKAFFDSGLLPVDGSGILSIRSAGPHTQIGYQHKPGMYYINWGSYEGDPLANKIYVAQPYRIVIADIYNDNLLGARTFYSPIPVQHPATPLYHVNLPNINCKGYRGNGVGWICLYHTEDISSYPFSEKVAKILERCSGVEAYNDANMSETDGPRFYKSHGKPSFVYNPQEWEKKSLEEGFEWTLDSDLWIPICVENIDSQGEHVADGMPLTYADAILGNYQAYYHDDIKPKPVNILSRSDLTINKNTIFDWFKVSYNHSQDEGVDLIKPNSLEKAVEVREKLSTVFVKQPQIFNEEEEEEEDSDSIECAWCEDYFSPDDGSTFTLNGEQICSHCNDNNGIWIEHAQGVIHSDSDNYVYSEQTGEYYLADTWSFLESCECGTVHPYDPDSGYHKNSVPIYEDVDGHKVCPSCAGHHIACAKCSANMPSEHNKQTLDTFLETNSPEKYPIKFPLIYDISSDAAKYVCNHCYNQSLSLAEKTYLPKGKHILDQESVSMCVCGQTCETKSFKEIKHSPNNTSLFFNVSFSALISNYETEKDAWKYLELLKNEYPEFIYEYSIPGLELGSFRIYTKHFCTKCLEKFEQILIQNSETPFDVTTEFNTSTKESFIQTIGASVGTIVASESIMPFYTMKLDSNF